MNCAHKFQRLIGTLVLTFAMMVSLQHCAAARPSPQVMTATAEASVPTPEPPRSTEIVLRAISLVGTPYRYGGTQPTEGLDCSGLVYYVYSGLGVDVPRTVREQLGAAKRVTLRQLQPGDLLF